MTKIIATALVLAVLATGAAAQNSTFFNSGGSSIGRAPTGGGTTTFRDNSGRITGSAAAPAAGSFGAA